MDGKESAFFLVVGSDKGSTTQMGVHSSTAKRFAAEGVLRAARADDRGLVLFEPVIGPLPQARPGKRFRDRRRYPQLASDISNEVQYEA